MSVLSLHQPLWEKLQARRSQLPHALLLHGQQGLGKLELARAFAASLLCDRPQPDGQACGDCPACHWLAQGNHPDFRLLQPAALAEDDGEGEGSAAASGSKKPSQQITIDQVRGLDDFLHVGTHRQGLRVVIVCPAEAMNRNTANALLKTLEEPLAATHFLLVSHEPDRLLPTIRSRCQAVAVATPERQTGVRWLEGAVPGLSDEDAARWLALAGGAPLLAADLAAPGEEGRGGKVTKSRSLTLLADLNAQLVQGSKMNPLSAAAALDKTLKADKEEGGRGGPGGLKLLVIWWQKWLVDLTLCSAGTPVRYFLGETTALRQLSEQADTEELFKFNRLLAKYKALSEHPLNTRLFLEELFSGYAAIFQGRPRRLS